MDKDSGASRASYDQLYKDLIKAFFADFLHLFDPDTAAGVDFSTLTFRDAEVFTDIPQGERRTADIVAEVRTKEGSPEPGRSCCGTRFRRTSASMLEIRKSYAYN